MSRAFSSKFTTDINKTTWSVLCVAPARSDLVERTFPSPRTPRGTRPLARDHELRQPRRPRAHLRSAHGRDARRRSVRDHHSPAAMARSDQHWTRRRARASRRSALRDLPQHAAVRATDVRRDARRPARWHALRAREQSVRVLPRPSALRSPANGHGRVHRDDRRDAPLRAVPRAASARLRTRSPRWNVRSLGPPPRTTHTKSLRRLPRLARAALSAV